MIKKIRVIILDFDGVVIESNAVKTEVFAEVFARFSEYADAMMAFHHANVSLSRFAKFEHLLELMGRSGDASLLAEIAQDFSRRVVKGIISVPLVPGAEDFLSQVTRKLPVYLASVTPADELDLILSQRGLSHWFRKVYGCPPWTKPDAVLDVLKREGLQPEEALLIGDSAGDQRAARTTAVCFLGRNSGLAFDEPLPLCFSDLTEIYKYLEGLLP